MKQFCLLCLVVFLGSCSFQPNNKSSLKKNSAPGIIGGELVEDGDEISLGVVALLIDDSWICTGSLISPNVILTAAHCVHDAKANQIKIFFGTRVDALLATLEPDIAKEYVRTANKITVHPGFDPSLHESVEWDWNDIALISFRGSHPEEYKPAKILPSTSWLKKGSRIQVTGYGVDLITSTEVDADDVENIEEALETGEVICENMESRTGCLKIESTGDGELRQTSVLLKDFQKTEFLLDESKGKGTCVGDSGGPAYFERQGELYIAGITSRGNLLCDEVGVYTNVAEFKTWIQNNVDRLTEK